MRDLFTCFDAEFGPGAAWRDAESILIAAVAAVWIAAAVCSLGLAAAL